MPIDSKNGAIALHAKQAIPYAKSFTTTTVSKI